MYVYVLGDACAHINMLLFRNVRAASSGPFPNQTVLFSSI